MEKKFTLDQLPEIAHNLSTLLTHNVVVFSGEMGAGKTTMITALCNEFDCLDTVSSPTFSLINEYKTKSGETLYHFDCYRIENEEEAFDFGAEDYLYSTHRCLVEWGENIANLLPKDHHKISLEIMNENTRKLTFI